MSLLLIACKESWEEEEVRGKKNKDNCSGFMRSVARKIGIPLPETNADGLVTEMENNWIQIETVEEALQKLSEGYFVTVGLKSVAHTGSRHHGHVAIVVDGELYRDQYPSCWCGSISVSQSRGNKSVGEVWNRSDRDRVKYFAYPKKINEIHDLQSVDPLPPINL